MVEVNPIEAFEPDWAIPPGATIGVVMSVKDISKENLAEALGESIHSVNRLLVGDDALDDDLAERLAQYLGTSKAFWMAREAQYRADVKRIREKKESLSREAWVKQFPVREMVNLGWIKNFRTASEAAVECLKLFGVEDVPTWQAQYGGATAAAAFRMSISTKASPGAITAWLRWAEVNANQIPCAPWNPEAFRSKLEAIKALTWQKDPATFLPKLRAICAGVGVAVVVARTPKGCPASGATKFVTADKALMVLSFRYRSDDQFWFTFFHEAGHLLLHGFNSLFLEGECEVNSDEEREANCFAESVIVPADRVKELQTLRLERDHILRFARSIGVAPGLIIGQLQHSKRVSPERLNWLKRRYDWDQIESDRFTP